MANLFTTQTPSGADNSDGAPGITTATTLRFAQNGYITAVRFYATSTVGGTYTGAVWQVTSPDSASAGTLLASEVRASSPAAAGWNLIPLDTPVPVTAGTLYRVGTHNSEGRYVSRSGFFNGAGLSNGDISALEDGEIVGGIGTIRQGTFEVNAALAYPTDFFGSTCYFADVEFVLSLEEAVTGSGAIALPSLTAAGAGIVSATGSGAIALPAITAAGAGVATAAGAGGLTLAPLAAAGSGTAAAAGSGAIVLPSLSVSGVGSSPITGAAALILPALRVTGSGAVEGGPSSPNAALVATSRRPVLSTTSRRQVITTTGRAIPL
ncbi:DUF4082 domain-containing protein [Actinoplanes sp. TBRC 11911]|uniref:DUF4082 domain-containing protein n=1 Tax=Actinoplanes sp. TBRC 11911 TaxID=2729386 RepID=UPI00145FCA3A|nr:DUF4082 domain-containing protein [Actinoplanes sp. TBRC 11911]NMO52025.1 DUF4082 domain-containing protein [Actinoplanes sp. TBRC 11911]